MRARKGAMMAKKKTPVKEPGKAPAEKASDWPPLRREVEATGEPDQPEEAIMHHKPKGDDLTATLSAMPGMNRHLAERMVEDGNWPTDASELAHKYGLMQLDAEEVLKVLNRNRGGK
jgi:hypothetical protein